jgi:nucleotide-binding universal stress UspA family protein
MSQPILIALSTFRHSEDAIEIIKSLGSKNKLVVCYFTDQNIYKYRPQIPFTCGQDAIQEIINQDRIANAYRIEEIVEIAKLNNIKDIQTYTGVGRFAPMVLEIVRKENPSLILTTRSERSTILKWIFGSPIDKIRKEAKCKVVEIG